MRPVINTQIYKEHGYLALRVPGAFHQNGHPLYVPLKRERAEKDWVASLQDAHAFLRKFDPTPSTNVSPVAHARAKLYLLNLMNQDSPLGVSTL